MELSEKIPLDSIPSPGKRKKNSSHRTVLIFVKYANCLVNL